MKLIVTPTVFKLLSTAQKPGKTEYGLLLAAKLEEDWYSNTAVLTQKVLDMILGEEAYSGLNSYLKEHEDIKIIPLVACKSAEDAGPFIRDANAHGYGPCIVTAADGTGLYQLEGSEVKREAMSMLPRLNRHLEGRINDLIDIIVAEYRTKGKKSFSKGQS